MARRPVPLRPEYIRLERNADNADNDESVRFYDNLDAPDAFREHTDVISPQIAARWANADNPQTEWIDQRDIEDPQSEDWVISELTGRLVRDTSQPPEQGKAMSAYNQNAGGPLIGSGPLKRRKKGLAGLRAKWLKKAVLRSDESGGHGFTDAELAQTYLTPKQAQQAYQEGVDLAIENERRGAPEDYGFSESSMQVRPEHKTPLHGQAVARARGYNAQRNRLQGKAMTGQKARVRVRRQIPTDHPIVDQMSANGVVPWPENPNVSPADSPGDNEFLDFDEVDEDDPAVFGTDRPDDKAMTGQKAHLPNHGDQVVNLNNNARGRVVSGVGPANLVNVQTADGRTFAVQAHRLHDLKKDTTYDVTPSPEVGDDDKAMRGRKSADDPESQDAPYDPSIRVIKISGSTTPGRYDLSVTGQDDKQPQLRDMEIPYPEMEYDSYRAARAAADELEQHYRTLDHNVIINDHWKALPRQGQKARVVRAPGSGPSSAKFTGTVKDSQGRTICFRNGKRTPCPKKAEQPAAPEEMPVGEEEELATQARQTGTDSKPLMMGPVAQLSGQEAVEPGAIECEWYVSGGVVRVYSLCTLPSFVNMNRTLRDGAEPDPSALVMHARLQRMFQAMNAPEQEEIPEQTEAPL